MSARAEPPAATEPAAEPAPEVIAPATPPSAEPAAPAATVPPDRAREDAYTAAVKARRSEGDVLALGEPTAPIFALQYAPGPVTAGVVVIAHDLDQHADWDAVVRPLRLGLAGRGRATLSVQLALLPAGSPRAAYGATLADAARRLRAAVAQARAQKYAPVVLLGYGFGALAALQCVSEDGCGANALATVSLPAGTEFGAPVDVAKLVAAIKIPVLDLYARNDYAEIVRAATGRAQAAQRAGLRYRQSTIETDHRYLGVEDELVRTVRTWLQRLPRA
jgi:alpha/beta superfamily hydrolase